MKNINVLKTFLLIILWAFSHLGVSAQFEEGMYSSVSTPPITGASLAANASNTIAYTSGQERSKKIKNVISFWLNERTPLIKVNFTATVNLKIEGTPTLVPSSTVQTQFRTLVVNYDTTKGAKFTTRAYILLDSFEQIKITVDTITLSSTPGWDPKPSLEIDNEMRTLRYYNLSGAAADLTPATLTATNDASDAVSIAWSWPSAAHNNASQLEWAWIPNELPAGYYATNDLIFLHNSTRVETDPTINNYKIPLFYGDTGQLKFRVRAVLRKNDGSVLTGPWSTPQQFSFGGKDTSLNWQSSTSFAENGKFKSVIQYFDGSMRQRQTVTKDSSMGYTSVAETIYDLQGRPSLQILPTPTISKIISYTRDFNRFDVPNQMNSLNNTDDPTKYFDLSITGLQCNGSPKLDTTFGNGKFYSSNNPFLSLEEKSKYTPNAQGYGFTETRYMDDATQRVSRQGGVGPTFQVGNGHDTKYFYGKPSQQELDALFATEVGDATHYSKNMVQDANGQVSVSYTDMHGRTIATALAGGAPGGIDSIFQNAAYYPLTTSTLTTQLLTPASNIVNGNTIESVSTLLVPASDTVSFTYKLDPAALSLMNCNNQQICFDCKYDLEISMRQEDCGNALPLVKKYNNLQVAACGSSMGFIGDVITVATKQISFSQLLTTGSWVIRKTLTLNDSIYRLRKDSALKVFLCRTEKNIYDSVYNVLIGKSGCYTPSYNTTRACDSCSANLGTFKMYRVKYLQSIGFDTTSTSSDPSIQQQYSQDSLACAGACGVPNSNLATLVSLRNQLLTDMIPYTGQYAILKDSIINPATGTMDLSRIEAKYNIFTTSYITNPGGATISKKDYYRFPNTEAGQLDYLTDNNQIDRTIEPANTTNDQTLLVSISNNDYTNLFQRSWAKSLIIYHPEYSKLKFAEDSLTPAFTWLDSVQACTTYATALAQKYLTPLTSDPYFVRNYVPADKQLMTQYLTVSIAPQGNTNNPSIWQLANGNVACAATADLYKTSCMSNAKKDGIDPSLNSDTVWAQFKGLYLGYRNSMIVNYINAQTGPAVFLPRSEMDSLLSQNKQLVFANSSDVAKQNKWTWWSLATATTMDTAAVRSSAAANVALIYNTDNCAAQRPFWKKTLTQCEQLQKLLNKSTNSDSANVNTIVNVILDSMVMVCNNSISAIQPYGNSTVNPSYAGLPQGFEGIINNVFKQNNITSIADSNYFCNPFTVNFPKPFGKNPPLIIKNSNIIDTCNCNRFSTLKAEAKASGYDTLNLGGSIGMNQFLLINYKDSLTAGVWQGLQKCNSSFYRDTCTNTISGPGYAYTPGGTASAARSMSTSISQPGKCPNPTINSVRYLNATSSTSNVDVNVTTNVAFTTCTLYAYNASGSLLQTINISCGTTQDVILSLPKCSQYSFTVSGSSSSCSASSGSKILVANCANCPVTAAISGVSYLNTSSSNNVQLNYTSSSSATNCMVVAKNASTGASFTQSITCGSTSVILSLPSCQGYTFQIYTGSTGNCYDSSNMYMLPACTLVCKKVYVPIMLPTYLVIPPFLACDYQKPCISCTALTNLITEFKKIYPGYGAPYTDTLNITDNQLNQNNLLSRFLNYRTGFSNNSNTYITAIRSCTAGTITSLCTYTKPLNDLSNFYQADTMPCRAVQMQSLYIASLLYQQQKDSLSANFDSLYRAKCLGAKLLEQFYAQYHPKEYHYTLYYYDQAGNLAKTLPPLAVKPNYDPTYLSQVNAARLGATTVTNTYNNEALGTQYRYNSLNQAIAQKTPDAARSQFWYDRLGRLGVSQNAKQALSNNYSYTLYDVLGRIQEVGQKPQTTAMTQLISQDTTALQGWVNGGGIKEQMTLTKYDEIYSPIAVSIQTISGLWQKNLRNRVSYTLVKDVDNTDPTIYNAATFYSYDIHGNVDTLLQDYQKGMGYIKCTDTTRGNRFKKMVYCYDLISGKVNDVAYQSGSADQFYHHYNYDPENRLVEVKTSVDKQFWESEARYDYYRHGPLARTMLGQNQVQGLDYAYTLQGWLKGVNSTAVSDGSFDMGKDGNSGTYSAYGRDVFGFSLNYFTGDYNPVSTSVTPFAGVPMSLPAQPATGIATGSPLYNGNIGAMVINIPQLGTANIYGYRYDQLNRITRMDAFNGLAAATNSFSGAPARVNDYHEQTTYDPNGNIQQYNRNGDSRANNMDSLVYNYNKNTNQLNNVTDLVTAVTPSDYTDIKTQPVNNYRYDTIGNIISDSLEKITNIDWSVYGKIRSITKSTGITIKYTYDASGNRISKIILTTTPAFTGDSTYYVRDASGNVMSVYNKKSTLDLYQTELHLYGSTRLGIYNTNTDVQNCMAVSSPVTIFTRGNKFFELSNHLGNVLATISDKIVQHTSNGTAIDYYNADVVTANDYYPFGMQMPGRKYAQPSSAYRYGFNGQEVSDEINASLTTAQYWEYDSRIGRRWNVDPIIKPWESPYTTFNNNPINIIDPNGEDGTPYKIKKGDNLSKIAKMAGTTVNELQKINDIKNGNKIKAGETILLYANLSVKKSEMLGNPEQDFKESQLTNYNNSKNGNFSYSISATTKELGASFVSNDGQIPSLQNTVVMGGPLLNDVKNLPSVQNLIGAGMQDLKGKKLEPGEYFKSSYIMSSIGETDGQRIYKQVFSDFFTKGLGRNYIFSAENFLGSYGFSMRVTGDGKQIAIAVYDSKSVESLADHKGWLEKRLPDLAPTYQRYLWFVPISKK